MLEDDLFDSVLDPVLRDLGSISAEGEEFRVPPLDVLRYYSRPARLGRVPILGRAAGVVAVVRQPVDLGFSAANCRALWTRLAMAVNGRFPPWGRPGGLAVGLTAVVLTPEPIRPDDDAVLAAAIAPGSLRRMRAVPLALFRLNLGQEAMAHALNSGPPGVFPEPAALADALDGHFRRFVPLFEP